MFFIVRGLRSDAWPSFRYKAVKIKGRTAVVRPLMVIG